MKQREWRRLYRRRLQGRLYRVVEDAAWVSREREAALAMRLHEQREGRPTWLTL